MVSPVMPLEDLFYWETQRQFKMDIFLRRVKHSRSYCSIYNSSWFILPKFKKYYMDVYFWDSHSTFLYHQKREIAIFKARFIWPILDAHFWLRWIKPQFPLTILTIIFLLPVTGNKSELLRCWYLPISWSHLCNLSLEKNLCESQAICRAGSKER